MILPALTPKFYASLVDAVVNTRPGLERVRLSALQRQLSGGQQELASAKNLDVWAKAG